MAHLSSVIFSTVLVCLVCIELVSAGNDSSHEKTKDELCYEYNVNCVRDLPLLVRIAHEYNSDAMEAKAEAVHTEYRKKDLENKIKVLRHRIDHPSEPALQIPELSMGMTGVPEQNFVFPVPLTGELSCPSLLNCLNTVGFVKAYIEDLNNTRNNYKSQIVSLTEEMKTLKDVINGLKQQITERNLL